MYLGSRNGRNHVCIYVKKQANKNKGTRWIEQGYTIRSKTAK